MNLKDMWNKRRRAKKKSTYYLVLLIGRARRVKLTKCWDFPGSPVVKNLPFNVGDKGSIPGQVSKIPCTPGQLSPCTALQSLHSTMKILCATTKTQCIQPNNFF